MKVRDIRRALTTKGFEEITNSDHYYFYFQLDGKRTSVFTKISHDATDVNDPLLGLMTKQVRLKRTEFNNLIDCRLDGPEYRQLLLERRHVTPSTS